MRLSDWSSDVCSSDLRSSSAVDAKRRNRRSRNSSSNRVGAPTVLAGSARNWSGKSRPTWRWQAVRQELPHARASRERKSVGKGRSVSERLDLGGQRIIKKNNTAQTTNEAINKK